MRVDAGARRDQRVGDPAVVARGRTCLRRRRCPRARRSARTADAHGPSSGSAIGASGTPNRHIVASGNSTSARRRRRRGGCSPRPGRGWPTGLCRSGSVPGQSACCSALTSAAPPSPTAPKARRRASAGAAARPGIPRSRSRSSIARQRTRGPNTPWPATLAHARSAAVSSAWIGWPGDVVVDQHLGQPLGQIRRPLDRERVAGQRQADRPVGVEQHPAAPPAQLVAGAVDDQPARRQSAPASPPMRRAPPRPAYWRSTLNARTKTGVRPANSKPPSPNSTPPSRRRRAIDPLGVDLQADDADVGAHHAQPRGQFQRGHRQRAVAEVDHQRIGGRVQRGAHPRANAPATGRCGAAGCSRWCRG